MRFCQRLIPLKGFRQPALAKTFVRYVGDPVAAVFAEDPYVAEDAAELVQIEIEELPVVTSASAPPGEFEPGRSSGGRPVTNVDSTRRPCSVPSVSSNVSFSE